MVEVHLMRKELAATVLTGDPPEVTQELERRALSCRDPIDLALAVPLVVEDVVRALIARTGHSPKMREPEESCQ
jgi:hypothetical protein